MLCYAIQMPFFSRSSCKLRPNSLQWQTNPISFWLPWSAICALFCSLDKVPLQEVFSSQLQNVIFVPFDFYKVPVSLLIQPV